MELLFNHYTGQYSLEQLFQTKNSRKIQGVLGPHDIQNWTILVKKRSTQVLCHEEVKLKSSEKDWPVCTPKVGTQFGIW